MAFAEYVTENVAMGGSMYERRDSVPHSSLRSRMLAELECFGAYAVGTDTKGVEPSSVSAPAMRGMTGATVVAHFTIASGPGAGADAPECLATLKPTHPGPHHAAFLITALASEMSKFASTRVLSDLADTLKSITVTQGTAHHVNIDGEPALGWALLATGATGIACQYHDRVVMWLGTEQAVMPGSIRTTMALPDQAGRIF